MLQGGPDGETAHQALDWFLHRAVPGCRSIDVGRVQLLQLLSAPSRHGPARPSAPPHPPPAAAPLPPRCGLYCLRGPTTGCTQPLGGPVLCTCHASTWRQVSDCLRTIVHWRALPRTQPWRAVRPGGRGWSDSICSRPEAADRRASGCSRRKAAAHSDVRPAHVDALVRAGLLARQPMDRFSFALPGVGPLIKSITAGRKARPWRTCALVFSCVQPWAAALLSSSCPHRRC